MPKNIKEELQKRKYHLTIKPFYWFYHLVMGIVSKKYNIHYQKDFDISKYDGPAFIMFNHLSRLDHVYVLNMTYPKRFNMLAGYNEFYRSHLAFAFKHNNVLPKKQYIPNDILGMRAISTIIKKGGKVAFAPEGLATNDGTPKPIVPNTGHMLKHYGIPVFFVELRGTYLQNTKVCLDERYGETYCRSYQLFSPDDLKNLSVSEIDDKINDAIRGDEYAFQKERHIKWNMNNRPCYNLHHLLYRCPSCNKDFVMRSNDNELYCSLCNFKATVDDYYDLVPLNNETKVPQLMSDWIHKQRVSIIQEIRNNKDFKFTCHAVQGRLPNDHYVKNHKLTEDVADGYITVDHTGFEFIGTNNHDYDFKLNYNELYTLFTEVDSSTVDLYKNGEFVDFRLDNGESIYLTSLVEEMHRLHVNFYKNFKWNDWMYKE